MNNIGEQRYVSTPNDYAVEVTSTHGATMTYGVCKWVDDGQPYRVWSAMQTSDGHTHWEHDIAESTDFSGAVSIANTKADWYANMVKSGQ